MRVVVEHRHRLALRKPRPETTPVPAASVPDGASAFAAGLIAGLALACILVIITSSKGHPQP